ncbi:DEAD/DEAH box helicase [Erwinia psidii]|uniref:DEAD/DEAH box helicase n=1 Tax=Erwinia psidii TaxID=69224 RepID=UPI00226B94B4|nr:DEAD/DEAH box helicase [Erwinia psidii]MCX8967389.1 DEAD/DEAH box helicase [Erwinia psidii]
MLNITENFAQKRALDMLRRDWKEYNSFMVYAPTGAGKTGMAAFIVDGFVSRGMRVLFCAPYITLVTQTAARFVQYGLPEDEIGYIWSNHPNYDPEKKIQIASADTLIRRDFPDNIDLLIIDEAHIRRAQLLGVIKHLTENTNVKVIGLSGTPFSPFLGKYYQRLIKPTTMKELIQRGDLSGYEFFAPSKPDLSGIRPKKSEEFGSDYTEGDLAEIMCGADLVGDIVKSWLRHAQDLPTICFCVNQDHAGFITSEFLRCGINAELVIAETPSEEREMIFHRFAQGATKVIVNVAVLTAGFDSDVRCIIYARPTKSEIRWCQALGRGLRAAPGKETCLILDHSGSVHRLGFPDSIEYNELPSSKDGEKKSASRKDTDKPEKKPRECTQCHFMKPAGVYACPKCGFKPVGGEDVDTDTSRDLSRINGNKREYTRHEMQCWWSQLRFYQRQRAMSGKPVSDGWCKHTFHDKFGVWPRSLHDNPMQVSPEVNNFIKWKQIKYAKKKPTKSESEEYSQDAPLSINTAKEHVKELKRTMERALAERGQA